MAGSRVLAFWSGEPRMSLVVLPDPPDGIEVDAEAYYLRLRSTAHAYLSEHHLADVLNDDIAVPEGLTTS